MRRSIGFLAIAVLAAGCASATPGQKGALGGSALGAGLGAIIGHQSGHTAEGALIGAAAGGLGGALVGEAMANKFCPTCGRSYFSDQTHCQFDGTELRSKGAPPQNKEQQQSEVNLPKFCATCGRSYPATATYCSEDGAALKEKKS